MIRKYSLGQRLMAYTLLISFLLESCYNPGSPSPIPRGMAEETTSLCLTSPGVEVAIPITDEALVPLEQAKVETGVTSRAAAPLSSPIERRASRINSISSERTSDSKSKDFQTRLLSHQKPLLEARQEKQVLLPAAPSSVKTPRASGYKGKNRSSSPTLGEKAAQEASASQVFSIRKGTCIKPLTAKGGHQVIFNKDSSGQWQAIVEESLPGGMHRRLVLPVYLELGLSIAMLQAKSPSWHKSHIHVIYKPTPCVFVGAMGLVGGMKQGDDENNNNNTTTTDLSGKLKAIYKADTTLPRLIEDERIPSQHIQDHYVKLQVVLEEDKASMRSASAGDQVIGEKQPVELENLFNEVDKDHPAVEKVLLLGVAGVGKTTLMHYISNQWADGKLWKGKYEHVFRVRLKELLNHNWSHSYGEKLSANKLACFIHYGLGRDKNKDIAPQEIMDILTTSKEGVLLLLDGYDEVAHMAHTAGYKESYETLMEEILNHPHIIMTSRPNALSSDMRSKFGRVIENKGLDRVGIHQYIAGVFKGSEGSSERINLGRSLQTFLSSNRQVMSICQIPINLALISLIWNDEGFRERFRDAKDFNTSQLYHDVVIWLGKRYFAKFKDQDPDDITAKVILGSEEVKFLTQVAYQSLVETGKLVTSEVVVAHQGKLNLRDVIKFGLLRPEEAGKELHKYNYQFIHLSFQEYLAACHVQGLLEQEKGKALAEVATWLAHHRNEPKYLLMLKFLAGLVKESKDELLAQRFWESMACNVEGVLELGVEGKVNLLMHLLSQCKIKGAYDPMIPNLKEIQALIDQTLRGDLAKWHQTIIETGYLPAWLVKEVKGILQKPVAGDSIKLQAAAEIASSMIDQGVFGSRGEVFEALLSLTRLSNWQIQKLGIEKAREVVDRSIGKERLMGAMEVACKLVTDKNLETSATKLLWKIVQINLELGNNQLEQVLEHASEEERQVISATSPELFLGLALELAPAALNILKLLLSDKDWYVRMCAAEAFREIVEEGEVELKKEAWDILKQLFSDEDSGVRKYATYAFKEIVKGWEVELKKEALNIFKLLFSDKDSDVIKYAAYTFSEIVKGGEVELKKEALNILKLLLSDNDCDVRRNAAYAFKEIVKGGEVELKKEAWNILKPLFSDKDSYVREHAAFAFKEIWKGGEVELKKEALNIFKQLFSLEDRDIKRNAASGFREIVEGLDVKLKKEAWNILKPLFSDKDSYVRKYATYAFREIVKGGEVELKKEAWDILKLLLSDKESDVRASAIYALSEIVKGLEVELKKEALNILKPLLSLEDPGVRSSAAEAFSEIVKGGELELKKEAWNILKPLLFDKDWQVRNTVASAFKEIMKGLEGELKKEALNILKPLLSLEDPDVRRHAASALSVIVEGGEGELKKEALNILKPLFSDKDSGVKRNAASAFKEIWKRLDVELKKEAWDMFKPFFSDKDYNVRSTAAKALKEIVKGLEGELKKEALNVLKPLFSDKDSDVRSTAASAFSEIVKGGDVELKKEAWDIFKPLFSDKDSGVKRNATASFSVIVKGGDVELKKEALNILKPLLSDKHWEVRWDAAYALSEIVEGGEVELNKEALNILKPLLSDKDIDVSRDAASTLSEIVNSLSFAGLAGLLGDDSLDIRDAAKEALATKFKSGEALAQIDYKETISLIKIIEASKSREGVGEALDRGARRVLQRIAENIKEEGIKWLHRHATELPNIPQVQAFLRAVLHTTLQDGIIGQAEADLLIKCIVERGITASIDLPGNRIVLEDNTYPLEKASKARLQYIASEVIKLSKDPIAQQYKNHQPLFKNNGSALPIAATDIEEANSVVDNHTKLASDQWHLSVMHLSDHHQREPEDTFLLLEQRSYVGDHAIHRIGFNQGKLEAKEHTTNPQEVGVIREAIFGNMEYEATKPRYDGSSFTLSQEEGEALLKQYKEVPPSGNAYESIHKLAKRYVREASDQALLDKAWASYKEQLGVVAYKKDQLLPVDRDLVRRDSRMIDLEEQGKRHSAQMEEVMNILEISGTKEDAAIKQQLIAYQASAPALFDYCKTFIWTLKCYIDAYKVASSGLIATSEKSSQPERLGRYVVEKALKAIPLLNGVTDLLVDAVEAGYDKLKAMKQDNKTGVINELLQANHTFLSEIEHSLAQAALAICERKRASIISPPLETKHKLSQVAGELSDKISALTEKIIHNYRLDKSPQAELAVQDVIMLMTKMYEEYEMLRNNRSGDKFYNQLAEIVCKGSLADMLSKSINRIDVSLVEGLFDGKTLEKLKKKASKGLWKKTRSSLGMECEEYFEQKYLKEKLNKIRLADSDENILASRMLLFQFMCEGILTSPDQAKALHCAGEFGKKYPNITMQIAKEYPEFFKDKSIARSCITNDPSLLNEVIGKLP